MGPSGVVAGEGTQGSPSPSGWPARGDRPWNGSFDVRRSGCVQFPGAYEEYRRRSATPAAVKGTRPLAKEYQDMSPRQRSKAVEQLRRSVAECEGRVTMLEAALSALEEELASPPPGADLVALGERHETLKSQIDDAVKEWEREAETLAALE